MPFILPHLVHLRQPEFRRRQQLIYAGRGSFSPALVWLRRHGPVIIWIPHFACRSATPRDAQRGAGTRAARAYLAVGWLCVGMDERGVR